MDEAQKSMLKGELTMIKSLISASSGMTGNLNQTTFPVTGPVVNIPALAMVGQVIRQQADALDKLASLVEKVINAS
jgi:hypothetical protein